MHHDKDLMRTCGVIDEVKNVNFKDLPPFKPSIELNFASEGKTISTNGQKIPSLE